MSLGFWPVTLRESQRWREKEGKTLKQRVIKSYLLNIPNKHTLMRIDVSFRPVND